MRHLVLSILALVIPLATSAAPLSADQYAPLPEPESRYLPEGTSSRGHTFPRHGPADVGTHLTRDAQRQRLESWAAAAEAVAAAHPGTRLAADLLLGAAHTHRRGSPAADLDGYRRCALRAVDAALPDDPAAAAAMLGLAGEELRAGNTPAAERWLERLERWAPLVETWTRDPAAPDRAARLCAVWERDYLPVRALWLGAVGRAREAAEALEVFAEAAPAAERTRRWRRTAEAYIRAKDRDAALRAAERAQRQAPDDRTRGELHLWRFYAKHGALDARGRAAPLHAPNSWSTTVGFRNDLGAVLGALANLSHVAPLYLELGSRAHLRGDEETALRIYLAAMDNPSVAREAEGRRDLFEGLLVAFPAAIRLKRFDVAERILDTVARIGAIPAERFDQLLVRLKNRRADEAQLQAMKRRVAEEAERRRAAAVRRPEPRAGPDAGPRLQIEAEEPGLEREPRSPPSPDPWPLTGYAILFGGAALLMRVLILRERRRRATGR